MKLKVVRGEMSDPVVRRFPYLKTELHDLVISDEGFRQLCQDYDDLVGALKRTGIHEGDTRQDLLKLKTALEVEILEQVTQKEISSRN